MSNHVRNRKIAWILKEFFKKGAIFEIIRVPDWFFDIKDFEKVEFYIEIRNHLRNRKTVRILKRKKKK